jgi:hypothetical protein
LFIANVGVKDTLTKIDLTDNLANIEALFSRGCRGKRRHPREGKNFGRPTFGDAPEAVLLHAEPSRVKLA